MSEILKHINNFCNECGYYEAHNEKTNRTHICNHKDCDDFEEDEHGEYRRCFVFSCPLGYEADIDDMKRLDPIFADTLSVGDWIVVEE